MKKAFIMLMSLVAMMAASTSLKAQEVAIELVPGWNWIAYPYAETVDLNTALGSFTPAVGDMIKSQFGNSTYSYGRWRGAVQSLNAGEGYHYFSSRTEPVILVFGLPSIPIGTLTVTTSEPTNITSTTAVCGGSAVSNDGTSVLMKGVCWATHPQPTTNDSYTEDGSGPGAFTAEMTELIAETEYYVRAYAVSVKGINYGEELSFTTAPQGILNGLFSVSENNQVCFSQGNLQYQASTNTWRFAENQWNFVGDESHGNVYEDDEKCNNNLVSSTYNGWIDLFGWGTSDHEHGANCYQPWSANTSVEDYYAYGVETNNLFDQNGQADWGCNSISNGGNVGNSWRTLTSGEWIYLFNTRNTASGIRWTQGNVNGVNGVIVLPDDWDVSNYSLNDANGGNFDSNTISEEDWTNLFEANGAVFLPAALQRIGTTVSNESDSNYGVYWSSSKCNNENAYAVHLYYGGINPWDNWLRCVGRSVRLVRPAQANTSYSIEAVPNPTGGGTITGAGTYDYYSQVTLTATANESYTFYQWKENGNMVSTENPYSFVAFFDRNLEAVFLESSTYPLLYSYNEGDHTATVIGRWDGVELTGELVIPETVMHNGETYTVTAIGDNAFNGCSNLTSVEFPSSLVSIGGYAFGSCSSLTSIEFPNSLESIGDWAFRYCNGFTSVFIPASVTQIGVNPFTECSNISQITVESGNAYYDSRDNCNAIIETNSNKLISGCLNTIVPSAVTSLGQDAFYIESLTSVTILAETPPTLGTCSFCGVDKSIPVYVPCASIEAYQNAEGWNEFTNFIEMCPGTITVTANPAEYGTVTGGGPFEGGETCTVTATPNEGCFFAYWSENGQMVSAETTYSFIVAGDRNLIALFYTNEPGMLNGLFSVSENTLVCFSQGNLQYQASTNTWRFAENQWDFVGEGNANASSTYDGWIDLFCYGTSGYNHGAVCYQPWSTSMNNNDYWAYGNGVFSLLDLSGEADWGYNPISNGGNTEGLWRTMTIDEWDYVLNYRSTTSGIRFVTANVNGFDGWILLPDNWEVSWFVLNYVNDMWASYENNVISLAEWNAVFESHGAVFLPKAGCKHGQSDIDYERGDYWSSSNMYYEDLACSISFGGGLDCGRWRCDANSIRLVQFVQAPSFIVNATPNQEGYGTINGTGVYELDQTCTLTAVPNEGYVFLNWKVNGVTASVENPYTFVVRYDRNLEATFYETSTYPLTYIYNEDNHTATVTGRVEGVELTGELVIPETVMHNGEAYTVTAIGDYAFSNCSGLTSVDIPNTVTHFNQYAFSECTGLTSVVVPNSVTNIGHMAFYGCTGLTSISFGNSLSSIEWQAFWGCQSLSGVVFPNSLTSIGWGAFRSCYGLTEIVIPSSVTSIEDNPFPQCSNIAQITVESGNAYYDSRGNCQAIIETATNRLVSGSSSTVIPNTVTSIGRDALNEAQIVSLIIPASVNYIADWGISGINTLSSMTVLAEVPPTLGDCAFCETDHSIPVYVPCASIEAYQNANGWSEFTNYIAVGQCSGMVTVTASPAEYGTVSGGGSFEGGETCTITATPNEGYYFLGWTENGQVVSTETTYTFPVYRDYNLTAVFYVVLGDELVVNGDFEQGDVGFTSEYLYGGGGPGFYNFSNEYPSHSDAGYYMYCDAAEEPGTIVWAEEITVAPNTYYVFSTWVGKLCDDSSPLIQFSINGTQIGGVLTISSPFTWKQFIALWYSGNSTTATITILDQNTEIMGNDFGLDDISFREMDPSVGGGDHAYVDLGLPSGLLWATCNVGADSPEDYGDYFAWGETQPKDLYDWSTYQHCNGSYNTLTKYCNDASYGYNGFTDNLTTLLPEDDAATANWGSGWRMPTKEEWQELLDNTTVTWTQQNGVNGMLFTASNGNSLFLPAAGCRYNSSLSYAGSYGYYWSSSLYTDYPIYAWYLYFLSDYYGMYLYYSRGYGHSVRPVRSSGQN